ncbi:MAG TPA: hypothetical protein VFB76_00965 [Candidatus Angelobacter sp.]|nr:hypothetical protein [Candidatus Angelobacter sp.]
MRSPLLFAILGLLAVEAFLLPRTSKDFQILQKARMEMMPESGRPLLLGPFVAYDRDGHPLALTTDETRWILPIVIHSNRANSDLNYLERLRKAFPSRALALIGVCDQSPCSANDQNVRSASSDFPILVYGSYAPLKDILRFDDHNEVLLTNQFWGVEKSLPRASSAEEMAESLKKVTRP